MTTKTGNTVNFIPTREHYDACDKMCMNWSLYVHKLPQPDKHGNTYYTDATTYGYLNIIIQRARNPWLGTALIIDMTPERRAMLDKMRGEQPATRVFKPRTPDAPAYVHPKQCGEKLHGNTTMQRMYCCDCGMDFYDHHNISTRVPIHCPWCESGHVSETDPCPDDAFITRTRVVERLYITTDEK